jgi:hypothetical protein
MESCYVCATEATWYCEDCGVPICNIHRHVYLYDSALDEADRHGDFWEHKVCLKCADMTAMEKLEWEFSNG